MWSDSACSVGVQCNFRTLVSTNPYITQAVIQGAYTYLNHNARAMHAHST